MITQNRLQTLFDEVKNEIKEIVPFSPYIHNTITINHRKTALGTCKRYNYGMFQIGISKYLLKCDEKLIKETLIHELIHTCKNCFNHGYNFIKYAQKVNNMLNYRIVVINRDKQFSEKIQYKYEITCVECGAKFYRHRLPKNINNIIHTRDNGKFIVKQLY